MHLCTCLLAAILFGPALSLPLDRRTSGSGTISHITSIATTMNRAIDRASKSITTDLTQMLDDPWLDASTLTSTVNSNLNTMADATTMAASGVAFALTSAASTISQAYVPNLDASISMLLSATSNIVDVVHRTEHSALVDSKAEASNVQTQVAIIRNGLLQAKSELMNYAGTANVVASDGSRSSLMGADQTLVALFQNWDATLAEF